MLSNNRSRILFVSTSSLFYGSERVLFEIIKSLGLNYEVHILLPAEGVFSEKLKMIPGITIHAGTFPTLIVKPANILSLLLQLPSLLFRYRKLFNHIQPNVLYINGMSSLSMSIVGKLLRCKTICHIHDKNGKKIDGWVYSFLVKFCCDKVIFISKYVQTTYLEKMPSIRAKSRVIYNGVNLKEVSKHCNPSSFSSGDYVTFLIVARLETQKNIIDAINALENVLKRRSSVRLLIVGDGTKRAELTQIIKERGLVEAVELIGYSENVDQFYDLADVVLCPFIGEGFGLVAVEAMAARKPIIAAADGGLLEIVEEGETGFFYTPGNYEELARKMEALINAELRAVMGVNGQSRACNFSQERQNEAIAFEISELLKSRL